MFHAGGSSTLNQSPTRRTPSSPLHPPHRPIPPPSPAQLEADAALHSLHLQRARLAFSTWDRDGDGCIGVEDVGGVLRAAGLPCGEEVVAGMVRGLDREGKGRVEWAEFEAAALHKMRRERYEPPADIDTEMTQQLRKQQQHRDTNQ